MSLLGDVLRSFSSFSLALLSQALQSVGAEEISSTKDDCLRAATVEVLSIGVEDLLDKVTDLSLRAKLSKKPSSAEELEAVVKKDIFAFLQTLSDEVALELAGAVGISGAGDADAARVKLFEEIVLLGAEGFFDLQEEMTLKEMCTVVNASGGSSSKVQMVESLMVRIFNLKSAPEKKVGSSRRRANEAVAPVQKKQKQQTFASKSDVNKMKVGELRALCESSGLPTDGLKPDLVDRVWENFKTK